MKKIKTENGVFLIFELSDNLDISIENLKKSDTIKFISLYSKITKEECKTVIDNSFRRNDKLLEGIDLYRVYNNSELVTYCPKESLMSLLELIDCDIKNGKDYAIFKML